MPSGRFALSEVEGLLALGAAERDRVRRSDRPARGDEEHLTRPCGAEVVAFAVLGRLGLDDEPDVALGQCRVVRHDSHRPPTHIVVAVDELRASRAIGSTEVDIVGRLAVRQLARVEVVVLHRLADGDIGHGNRYVAGRIEEIQDNSENNYNSNGGSDCVEWSAHLVLPFDAFWRLCELVENCPNLVP